jgi:hypothetical protein
MFLQIGPIVAIRETILITKFLFFLLKKINPFGLDLIDGKQPTSYIIDVKNNTVESLNIYFDLKV